MHESTFTPAEARENDRNTPFDVVIVLGDMDALNREDGSLGLQSTWRVLAAGSMYQRGLAKNLLFTGGHTAGSDKPSEARRMPEDLDEIFTEEDGILQRIPQDVRFFEEEATDTSSNLLNVKKMIQEQGWKHVGILTSEYRIPRAMELAKNVGLEASGISAEEQLIAWDERFQAIIEKHYASDEMKQFKRNELIYRALLRVDPKGQIPNAISKITRR